MRSLLENNQRTHAAIIPILRWPKSILDEPADTGPWMTARQPIQFVAEHGLLQDSETGEVIEKKALLGNDNLADPYSPILARPDRVKFDRKRAEELFEAQFGPLYTSFHAMPKELQKLGLAFLLYGSERKDEAYTLLDSMSRSFYPPQEGHPRKWERSKTFPFFHYKAPVKAVRNYRMDLTLPLSGESIDSLLQDISAQRLLAPHQKYQHLFILALYEFARQKGVLTTAEFIWLRPLNRSLFYLLNNFGRRTAWTEIAGPWAHYQAETRLFAQNPELLTKLHNVNCKWVSEAVNALEFALYEEGWIAWESLSHEAKDGRLAA